MGATVAVRFASAFPEKVDKLVLLAPAGLRYSGEQQDWITRVGLMFFKIPVIGSGFCKIIMPVKMMLSADDPERNARDAGMMYVY